LDPGVLIIIIVDLELEGEVALVLNLEEVGLLRVEEHRPEVDRAYREY